MPRKMSLQAGAKGILVRDDQGAQRVAVGIQDRAECHVQHLARVELVQQIGQIRIGNIFAGRHLAQLRVQKVGFAIMLEVCAGVIEHVRNSAGSYSATSRSASR